MTELWQTLPFSELDTSTLYAIMRMRQAVFVVEQTCPYQDLDDLDQQAMHMLNWRDGELLAYQRCLAPGISFPQSSIGRICVAPAGRGSQLGRQLVQRGIEYNDQNWPDSGIQIGAQAHLQKFYRSLGFIAQGNEFLEDGIPHIHMVRPPANSQA